VQPVISAKQAREIDSFTTSQFNIPSIQLMAAAAEACFKSLAKHFAGNLSGRKAQILCGTGNNGGDGAALAGLLCNAGVRCDVVLFGEVNNTRDDALANFEIIRDRSVSADAVTFQECEDVEKWRHLSQPNHNYDIIVDGLFGTGLSRPLAGLFLEVAQDVNKRRNGKTSSMRPFIFSIDLPSGLDADSAMPIGEAIHADLTVTFTASKPANILSPASYLNGELEIAAIGSPDSLVQAAEPDLFVTEETDARDWLIETRYQPDSFKNSHGHVLVIAGSRGYTGAAVLCADAAMRSGAGLVTVATSASAQSAIAASAMPEVMTAPLPETDRGAVSDDAVDRARQLAAKATVVAIGPGLSTEDQRTRDFVFELVKQRTQAMVIDADALNCLSAYRDGGWPSELQGSANAPLILTPHPGEMLRLLGTGNKSALADRVKTAREFALKHKLILVLKGGRSIVAAPDGQVFVNPTGNPGLGTAGAGDTLTGIIAGFVAQQRASEDKDPLAATIAALYIGGLAGDFAARALGMRSMVASDIREHLSEAIQFLDPDGERPHA
jgi:ADP-dependent NAD(P)H-hydrate dehydratase / NAD(P)H-hydrate epimerase